MRLAAEPGRRYQIGPLVRAEDDRDRVRTKRRAKRIAETLFSALREWLASSRKAEQINEGGGVSGVSARWLAQNLLVPYRQVRRRRAPAWTRVFPAGALAIGGFGRSRWRLRRTRRAI